jgi:Tol biopolymer transport system component
VRTRTTPALALAPPLLSLALGACLAASACKTIAHEPGPFAWAEPADHLIEPGEKHFARLWKLTSSFDNAAEGYWSFAGDRLVFQGEVRDGPGCDQIYVTDAATGAPQRVSNGAGKTTCAYFLPGDGAVVYASTHLLMEGCPPRPDYSRGYVWSVHPEFDLFVHDLATGKQRRITEGFGYDAEATVSPLGDRMVFTSTRSGDLELWTCDLDGGDLVQVTDAPGYDGGAFFSHDGGWLVYRRTRFSDEGRAEEEAAYRALLQDWKVRPQDMDVWIVRPDGTDARRVTDLGKASFAPYFFPGDRRIVFASNWHDTNVPAVQFDLFAVDLDGTRLEQITTYDGFDSFPMFSPDGRWIVFASNRGGSQQGETNLFVAEWR